MYAQISKIIWRDEESNKRIKRKSKEAEMIEKVFVILIKILSQLSIGGIIVSLIWLSIPFVTKKQIQHDKPICIKLIFLIVCISIYIITKI